MQAKRLSSAVLGVFLAGIASAQNVRTFVATSGLDSNDCLRTTPCRTFNRAIAETNVNGEVIALDSGGYGAATITQSITILAPDGVHAAIAPTAGAAITVTLEATENVLLQNLFLTSHGATNGVFHTGLGKLVVIDLVVSNFEVRGVSSDVGGGAGLTVRSSIFRGNGDGTSFRLYDGFGSALIENSLYSDNNRGVLIDAAGTLAVVQAVARNVNSIRNRRGFRAEARFVSSNAQLDVDKCAVVGDRTLSSTGIEAEASLAADNAIATVRVSDSIITANGTAISTSLGSVLSRQNNTVEGNLTGETFTGIYFAK